MTKEKSKILITGGGTGGHVMPALAVYDFLKSKGFSEFLYVGGYKGMENSIIPERKLPYKRIWISGFARGKILSNLLFPIKLVVSLIHSLVILLTYRPDLVIGTGGYVTGPVVYTASILGFKTMIVEQDVHPGVTTRLLAGFADAVCIAFPETASQINRVAKEKIKVTGNPVRPEIIRKDRSTSAGKLGLDPKVKTVLVFGGSQGAEAINDAVRKNLSNFAASDIQLIWQTGQHQYEQMKKEFINTGVKGTVQKFIEDMAAAYSACDMVVARAGAISIAEIGLMRLPAVLVPYPFAAGNHQEINARAVQEAGAAVMIVQSETDFPGLLWKSIEKILFDEQKKDSMAKSWEKLVKENATEEIYKIIKNLLS